ncbi:MAG: hypothetical protein K6T65_04900 [Peptococcaceae bacterium]|nr:hypothetical protein [Peptococcaceae bacterium]
MRSFRLSNLKIPPVRLVYILSLVVLGVLLILSFLQPMATGKEYSTVQKEQLVKTEDGWFIQFEIFNNREEGFVYTVREVVDNGEAVEDSVLIPGGGRYFFNDHIFAEDAAGGKVTFTIYRQGETTPAEQMTYYLK